MFNLRALSPILRTYIIVVCLTGALLSLLVKHYREHSRAVAVVLQTAPVDPRSIFQGDFVTLGYDISRLDLTLFETAAQSTTGGPSAAVLATVGQGDTVYVALKDAGMIWTDLRASFTPFTVLKPGERMETRLIEKDITWRVRSLFDWSTQESSQLSRYEYVDGAGKTTQAQVGTPYYVLQRQIGPVWQPVRASTKPLIAQAGEVILRGKALSGSWESHIRVSYGIEAFFVPEGQGQWIDQLGWGRGEPNRMLVRVKVGPSGTGYTDNLLVDGKEIFPSGGLESWSSWRE